MVPSRTGNSQLELLKTQHEFSPNQYRHFTENYWLIVMQIYFGAIKYENIFHYPEDKRKLGFCRSAAFRGWDLL